MTRILDPKQTAQIVGVPTKSLAYMRSAGIGPSYLKLGKKIYYFEDVVSVFVKTRSSARAEDQRLSPAEVAQWTNISESTLFEMRETGDGPKFSRQGRKVEYRQSDVVEYLISCIRYTSVR